MVRYYGVKKFARNKNQIENTEKQHKSWTTAHSGRYWFSFQWICFMFYKKNSAKRVSNMDLCRWWWIFAPKLLTVMTKWWWNAEYPDLSAMRIEWWLRANLNEFWLINCWVQAKSTESDMRPLSWSESTRKPQTTNVLTYFESSHQQRNII